MKRSFAAAAGLAVGVAAGTGSMATFASWQDPVSLSGATLTAGHTHFAVDHPENLPSTAKSSMMPGESVLWQLPANVLKDLKPNKPQSAVVQIDAQSQGNRGLAYTLDHVQVHGNDAQAKRIDASIVTVPSPSECVPGVAAEAASPLHAGKLLDASLGPRELVISAYTDASWTHPETEYLCLDLSIPKGADTMTGTATVTGTAVGGIEDDGAVTASDRRPAKDAPSEGARNAVIELSFSHSLYRPGSGP